ncbi:protein-(glutamine-N5) methyltransferase, release factor-specific [Actinomycetes bacterium]|nr:protein-(glutamine-N5) methyltransferase, release factor-specific [Actinomycetes bacterium]
MNSDETITWGELCQKTSVDLGSEQEARWLCEHASGLDTSEFGSGLSELVSQRCGVALREMVRRRLAGEPLQYVIKRWAFRHLDVMVDPRVLIPRPETELVVQVALDLMRATQQKIDRKLRIVDLGTGSGVIGLALASELPLASAEVWLTDISNDALDVARANLAGLGLVDGDVHIAQGNWFSALPKELENSFDLIISNPPYIAVYDASVESVVRDYEPHLALYAGPDGLDAHREIISQSSDWLATDGWLVLEIGHDQGASVHELLNQNGFGTVEIRQDHSQRDRIAIARK